MDYGEFQDKFQEQQPTRGKDNEGMLGKRLEIIYNFKDYYFYSLSLSELKPLRMQSPMSVLFSPSSICALSIGLLCCIAPHIAYSNNVIYRYIDPQGRLVFTDKPKHSGYIQLEKTPEGWKTVQSRHSWKQNQRRFSPTIAKIAQKHDLSHHLVHAVIMVESAYDPKARSRVGAQGLMQLMPVTAHRFGVNDPYDPYENINGGTEYLKHLIGLFDGNLTLALAAYNAGENAVKRYNNQIPPFKETQRYVKKVLHHYRRYASTDS